MTDTGRNTLTVAVNAVSAKSGGAATYLRNLARELATSRHHYVFYAPPGLAEALSTSRENLTAVATDIGYKASWQRFLWDQFVLRRSIRELKVDILLSSSDFGLLAPPCKQLLMIRNPLFFSPLYEKKILSKKSLLFKLQFYLRRRLIALSARFSQRVITASRSMRDDVGRFIKLPEGRAVVNPFGVPLERFRCVQRPTGATGEEAATERLPRALRLLYVSEYSDYKNLTTLLKAVLLLREQGCDGFRLVTTARPDQFPEVELATRAIDKALAFHPLVAPCVEFTGSVPYEKIAKLYQESDVFVFPSMAESFGHPLVEAMASGLPIIASDIPIHREMCGDAAVYFRPLDPHDLAETITQLRADPLLGEKLGRAGRTRVEAHFDWKDHVRRLVEMIEQVAAEG